MTGTLAPLMQRNRAERGRRLKVLVSAYACHPEQGSEPGVGWHWVRELAAYHDIWLLTEGPRFSEPTAAAIDRDESLRGVVTVVPIPRVRAGERWFGSLAYYATYELWQRAALAKARELHAQVRFDLVHQLNMIGYREPGYLWSMDLPFVWGPIGGFAQMPWRYLSAMGMRGALSLGARNVMNGLQMHLSSRVRKAMSGAGALIAATSVDERAIASLYAREAVLIHETGYAPDPLAQVRVIQNGDALRVLWCGRMVPSKGVGIALHAIAGASRSLPIEFHLCGSGPQEAMARSLAERLGILQRCVFHGQVSHAAAVNAMRKSHVLLFPSLQEATSATVPEALGTGLPVLCHDICGQGDIVTQEVGARVAVSRPADSAEGFSRALVSMWSEPGRLTSCSAAAIRRASELTWGAKARTTDDLYRALVDQVTLERSHAASTA